MKQAITTLKVNCQDCHRCVRSCPVKAIGIEGGHASVVLDKCVLCGECVVECPQHAKQVENQLDIVKQTLATGRKVAFSIAPSFVAAFTELSFGQLRTLLKGFGACAVEETAVGAAAVSDVYASLLETTDYPIISCCCPVVTRLVEKYYPDLTRNLAPVVSPMIAHGRILKEKLGNDVFVVFIGPCIAKIAEGRDSDVAGSIDAVLTFDHLQTWLSDANALNTDIVEDNEALDVPGPSRFFPITGGILKSFTEHDETDTDVITVHGIKNCMEVFECLSQWEISPRFVEALACEGGCIGGPGFPRQSGTPVRRARIVDFARQSLEKKLDFSISSDNLLRHHDASPVIAPEPNEIEIREILAKTAKLSKADEKNCGACGYNTCREKAIAVWQGLAEVDMCIPYMKSKAESFSNMVIDNSLNTIIVVDENMVIQEFNPAAEKMFGHSVDLVKGTNLARIIDCTDLLHAVRTQEKLVDRRVEYPERALVTEQMILPIRDHNMVILIVTDVSEREKKERELQKVKLETIDKAAEIINRQMHVAQEIAGLLGETTGETKAALLDLVGLLKERDGRA
ncbi:MAG TPA: [Fe-Fe] hydrogenase large subunit C-terminal domain-containing protein [Negativicutes bacterium]|nr:[Fe-Fe] hydrogenase large subunit C-terminal domain-containing protein [Negativicutes bacterium]